MSQTVSPSTADSDEVARVERHEAARDSGMMPPTSVRRTGIRSLNTSVLDGFPPPA